MLSPIQGITFQTRKHFAPWFNRHARFWSIARSIYTGYTELAGPLHLLPNFLIIGAKKCGTTSLYLNLVKHPNVAPSSTKEIDYFNKYFEKGENWYRCCFPFKFYKFIAKDVLKKDLISGEATPTYIYHPLAPKRVKDLVQNMKLIVILRNPVERAFSHYSMEVRHGNENLTFEDAIEQEEKRLEGEFEKMQNDENYFSKKYEIYSYLSCGIYVNQLERWLKYFSRNQILVINSDDFKVNLNSTFNKVFEFLNLSKWEIKDYKEWEKSVYTEKINPDTRKKLVEYFKPYNEKLNNLLGTNFNWD